MLQQALNRHPAVVIPPETAYFTFLEQPLSKQISHLKRIAHDLQIPLPTLTHRVWGRRQGRGFFEYIARRYLDRGGRLGVTHFGEKSPEHLRRHQTIQRLFPEAKLLLIYRDGRDVALSLSRVPWMPHDLAVGFALWLHYCRDHRRAQRAFGPNLFVIRYEDLVERPEEQLQDVCQFLELDYREEMAFGSGNQDGVPAWEHDWKAQAVKPISASRVGQWRTELTDEQVGILERWGGNTLRSLGYQLVTGSRRRIPLLFFPKLYWRAFWWLATRPSYGEVDYRQSPQTGRPASSKEKGHA
jgi:hypothetical protein